MLIIRVILRLEKALQDMSFYTGEVLLHGIQKKQRIVALSTTEAEYISAADCCKELKYLKTLLEEITGKEVKADMYVDNQSAIQLVKSGQVSRKSKHIDIRYHFIAEQYKEGWFTIKYCPTNNQMADIFTKPLDKVKFVFFRDKLMSS